MYRLNTGASAFGLDEFIPPVELLYGYDVHNRLVRPHSNIFAFACMEPPYLQKICDALHNEFGNIRPFDAARWWGMSGSLNPYSTDSNISLPTVKIVSLREYGAAHWTSLGYGFFEDPDRSGIIPVRFYSTGPGVGG